MIPISQLKKLRHWSVHLPKVAQLVEPDLKQGCLASESGPLAITPAFSAERSGRWGSGLLGLHHVLTQILHPHRKLELEDWHLRWRVCPLPPCPAHPTPRGRGRVQSPWVSMTLCLGVVNIKPTDLLSSESPETSWTTLKEAGKRTRDLLNHLEGGWKGDGTAQVGQHTVTWSLSPSRIALGPFLNDQQPIPSPTGKQWATVLRGLGWESHTGSLLLTWPPSLWFIVYKMGIKITPSPEEKTR